MGRHFGSLLFGRGLGRLLPPWLSRLRLWPGLVARTFWETTIRGARDQIKIWLDAEHVMEARRE